MKLILLRTVPAMLLTCLPTHAQSSYVDTTYIIVVDRSGAPVYTAQATAQVLHWTGYADANGRIGLPKLPRASELLITAQGFRPLHAKSDDPVIEQHRAVLDVGGGSRVEVQPSLAEPQAIALAPLQSKLPADAPAQASPQRVRVSSGVIAGQKLRGDWPRYPEEAKAQHVNGRVVMHIIIDTGGKVLQVTPISGPELLRKPYADAVRQWEYRPYLLNGRPVEVESTVTLSIDIGG